MSEFETRAKVDVEGDLALPNGERMLTAFLRSGQVIREITCKVTEGNAVATIEVVSVGVPTIDMVEKGVVTLLVRIQPANFPSLAGRSLKFE